MLEKIREFFVNLNQDEIRYCHWKSNLGLPEALTGETDIDILIARKDAVRYRAILSQLGFQPAVLKSVESYPSVEHHFALDTGSGILVHVHSYYRVITGESLAKNYRFPIEEMLLENRRQEGMVYVPTASAELLVFTLRIMMKHTSLMELLLLSRDWKQVKREVIWLLESASVEETIAFAADWMPALDGDLLRSCIEAIKKPASLMQRIRLGNRIRAQLHLYGRNSALRAWGNEVKKFSIMLYRRLTGSKLGMIPQSGGAVIAFVGSEATGKSTLLAEIKSWLGEHFEVEQVHAGKPKSTAITLLPNVLLPALRRLLPSLRSSRVATSASAKPAAAQKQSNFPLLFGIRSVSLAYDRRALLSKAYQLAANGTIVLCDRYPSKETGAPDSPQLTALEETETASSPDRSLRARLTHLEHKFYREIPPPDLVIYLTAPLEITIARNANRGKYEPEDFVRLRHAQSSNLQFNKTTVYKINTDQPFEETLMEVKKAIWNAL